MLADFAKFDNLLPVPTDEADSVVASKRALQQTIIAAKVSKLEFAHGKHLKDDKLTASRPQLC
jgi:hypothetical protein